MADVFDRIRTANPVDDLDRFAEAAGNEQGQLVELRQRINDGESSPDPRPVRALPQPKWRVAVAAAAVVVLLVGAALVVNSTGERQPDFGSLDLTPVETVELHLERFENGDIEGMYEVFSPDLVVENVKLAPTSYFGRQSHVDGYNLSSQRWYVEHATMNAECTADGNVVTCDFAPVGLFSVKDENGDSTLVSKWTDTFTVENGLVTYWYEGLSQRTLDSRRETEYGAWLKDTYPNDHAELFAFGSLLSSDEDMIQRHHDFIAEWAGIAP